MSHILFVFEHKSIMDVEQIKMYNNKTKAQHKKWKVQNKQLILSLLYRLIDTFTMQYRYHSKEPSSV